MKNLTISRAFGRPVLLAAILTFFAAASSGQTSGGNPQLNSQTLSWVGLTSPNGVPFTPVFTPTTDSYYLLTAYLAISAAPHDDGDTICAEVKWTDPLAGLQTAQVAIAGGSAGCAIDTGRGGTAGGTVTINVAANTTVYVRSTSTGFWKFAHTANMIVSKTRLF